MDFVCSLGTLRNALDLATLGIADARTFPEISAYALLRLQKDGLHIAACDGIKGLLCRIQPVVSRSLGECLLHATKVRGMLQSMTARRIAISVDEKNQAVLKSKAHRADLRATSTDGFPSLPSLIGEKDLEVDTLGFCQAIERVVRFVATSSQGRPEENICLEVEDSELRLVGSDGHRIAIRILTLDSPSLRSFQSLLVPESVKKLVAAFTGVGHKLAISQSENRMIFRTPDIMFFTQLARLPYINYRDAFPTEAYTVVTTSRQKLLRRASFATVLSPVGRHDIKLSITKSVLRMSAQLEGIGSCQDMLNVEQKGDDVEVLVNGSDFCQALSIHTDEMVRLLIRTPTDPVLIDQVAGRNCTCLLLPLLQR